MKTKTILFDDTGILSIDDKTANIFTILIGSLLIGILAQISIPIPFSPVPITGQTIGVVLVGALLGSKKGALSVLCYLMEGAMGIPVFAQMKAGAHVLVGPTAGYLWGFVIAAFLIGYLAENGLTSKPLNSFLSCFAATTLILIFGTIYLAAFKLGFNDALLMGFYPFLVGDVVKSAVCAVLITSIRSRPTNSQQNKTEKYVWIGGVIFILWIIGSLLPPSTSSNSPNSYSSKYSGSYNGSWEGELLGQYNNGSAQLLVQDNGRATLSLSGRFSAVHEGRIEGEYFNIDEGERCRIVEFGGDKFRIVLVWTAVNVDVNFNK